MHNSTTRRFGRRPPQGDGWRANVESLRAERQRRHEGVLARSKSRWPFAIAVAAVVVVSFCGTVIGGLIWPTLWPLTTALTVTPTVEVPSSIVTVPEHQQCSIKGNLSEHGVIYHMPGDEHYRETRIDTSRGEQWFCTEAEAQAAGWRRAMR